MADRELQADLVVVGAGLVGLATAWTFAQRHAGTRVLVLEKESRVGLHQSGRNSGVLHSGIYYKPGSLKALTCRAGLRKLEQFCEEHSIRWQRCGKLIVAVNEGELPALEELERRGRANGVSVERLGPNEIQQCEPHAAGIAALRVHDTGIIDYAGVCKQLVGLLHRAGHRVVTSGEVFDIKSTAGGVELKTRAGGVAAGHLINCAGLYSDRLARMAGLQPAVRIIPFRGEYYELKPGRRELCRNLIYPVPDPAFPFLGVHLTRMIDGSVECGPNAVLAWAREGYRWTNVSPRDLWDTVSFPGFRQLTLKYWKTGLGEMKRSLWKGAFVAALQRLVPGLRSDDLTSPRAGVRAQAVREDGQLADDFLWMEGWHQLHVLNAPSPAATACLAIAEQITDQLFLA
jgi:L-2-hydroxyglutarate oxidase